MKERRVVESDRKVGRWTSRFVESDRKVGRWTGRLV